MIFKVLDVATTQSEAYFKEFLTQRNFKFEKIKEGVLRVSDYKIFFNKMTVIGEVKEFNIEKLPRNKISTMKYPPGLKTIREKIKTADGQFKQYPNKPTLLVLCNNRPTIPGL